MTISKHGISATTPKKVQPSVKHLHKNSIPLPSRLQFLKKIWLFLVLILALTNLLSQTLFSSLMSLLLLPTLVRISVYRLKIYSMFKTQPLLNTSLHNAEKNVNVKTRAILHAKRTKIILQIASKTRKISSACTETYTKILHYPIKLCPMLTLLVLIPASQLKQANTLMFGNVSLLNA